MKIKMISSEEKELLEFKKKHIIEESITDLEATLHQSMKVVANSEKKKELKTYQMAVYCLREDRDRLNNIIEELEQENERLKVKLENKLTPDELVSMLNQELVRQNKNYKSRNEKAIEYIGNGNIGIPRKTRDKFISILKGDDK